MATLNILKYPNPLLKEVCEDVTEIDGRITAFIRDLVDTMRASPGVGLAAPQIGALLRIIAVDVTPRHPGMGLAVLINPCILAYGGSRTVREGCLSVPDYTANITRAATVTVKGVDPEGTEVELCSTGFEAVVFQHEIDHLDGVLFLDRIANVKRDLFRRKIKEL
ncbi:MAG: peptide deformylase [Deltaproteobacteria bacterium]|nr:peptide deformylase [Deltaproteobacteria bacterium]